MTTSTRGSRTRRLVAATVAFTLGVTGVGLTSLAARAGSAVTPEVSHDGVVIIGTVAAAPVTAPTASFGVTGLDGPAVMLSGRISAPVEMGTRHEEADIDDETMRRVGAILSASSVADGRDPTEIAAAQGAVWNVTDGFELSLSDTDNDPAVSARYRELLAVAAVDPDDEAPIPTVGIEPEVLTVRSGDPGIVDVRTDSADPVTIEVSDPAVTLHPVVDGTCDRDATLGPVTGSGKICATAAGTPTQVDLTARSAIRIREAVHLYRNGSGSSMVGLVPTTDQSSARSTLSWTPNTAPTAAISCPAGGLRFDEPVQLVGSASDADGDSVTWRWSIDGRAVEGARSGELTVDLDPTTTVGLTVTDSRGGSVTTELNCGEARPPSVRLECEPGGRGAGATLVARGTDPDGDALVYRWSVGSVVVAGVDGDRFAVDSDADDPVTVVAVDPTGLTSESAAAPCTEVNSPPVIEASCPADLELGRTTGFTATGHDPDGDEISYSWTHNGLPVGGSSSPEIEVDFYGGDIVSVVGIDSMGASSEPVDLGCVGVERNSAPIIGIVCPSTVVDGRIQRFTVSSVDEDGDPLTYRWFVDGVEVSGESGSALDLASSQGQAISADASDGVAWSERVTTQCRGSARSVPPTVTVSCPLDLMWGETAAFIANGVDPADRGPLVYAWFRNGAPLGEPGTARLRIALDPTDTLEVVATSADGVASIPAASPCVGRERPTVALVCPGDPEAPGPGTFTAAASGEGAADAVYEWRIGDEIAEDATAAEATLALRSTKTISVRAMVDGVASDWASSSCRGESTPTVEAHCPPAMVLGEPQTITAVGDDADGDSLTYRWTLDGLAIGGATRESISVALGAGSVLAVVAVDPTGRISEEVTLDCDGRPRPTVDLSRPDAMTAGAEATWVAIIDGTPTGPLEATWAVNGRIIPGQTAPTVRLVTSPGDDVAVNVADPTGLVSRTVSRRCMAGGGAGEPPSDAALIPSNTQILGSTALQEAMAVSADPTPLARTGMDIARLLLVALAAMGAGAFLVTLGVRPRADR